MNIDCYFDLRIGEEKDTTNAKSATYGTFLERDQALEILAEEKESEDPFFMYLAWQGLSNREMFQNAENLWKC